MAVNSFTYNFDEILSTTLLNYRKKMMDNVFLENPTWRYFHAPGRKKTESGGERLVKPVQYGKNTTTGSYSGYDQIDITPQDNQTSVFYNWKQFGGSIVIDGMSEFKNKEPHRVVSLLQAKISEAEATMVEDLNDMLWKATPASTKDILSIPSFVVRAPSTTDAQSPGGISGATYSWWRNQTKTSAATTWAAVVREAKHVYYLCKTGIGGFPDAAICNLETYEYIENTIADLTRYTNPDLAPKTKRSPVVENMRFKGATLWYDDHIADAYGDATTAYDYGSAVYGSLYFLNSKYLYYVVGEGMDFEVGKFVKTDVTGQDARLALIKHYHALVCDQRRKHGVLEKINKALTS